jgi:exonuclease SbcC
LQKALEEKPAIEKSENVYKEMLAEKRARRQVLFDEQEKLQLELEQSPFLEQKLQELQPEITTARSFKEEAGQRLAVLSAQTNALSEELQSLSQKRIELDVLKTSIDDYQFLAEAFGKRGIQAVIIENAIPEIENEANRILSRLTENKMHIALVTQHKTKTGTTVETLDLLIGDEMGTRNYELFSGGEAFKVNFAVRVALARLLARRAGAKLETLIIDEGFGSQDDASRERLVRAIKAIQTDFARILVITHMADIKEMFPTQIQVSKVNGASQLEILY